MSVLTKNVPSNTFLPTIWHKSIPAAEFSQAAGVFAFFIKGLPHFLFKNFGGG